MCSVYQSSFTLKLFTKLTVVLTSTKDPVYTRDVVSPSCIVHVMFWYLVCWWYSNDEVLDVFLGTVFEVDLCYCHWCHCLLCLRSCPWTMPMSLHFVICSLRSPACSRHSLWLHTSFSAKRSVIKWSPSINAAIPLWSRVGVLCWPLDFGFISA